MFIQNEEGSIAMLQSIVTVAGSTLSIDGVDGVDISRGLLETLVMLHGQ